MSVLNSVENLTDLNTKAPDRNKAFDGIRGYAALIVIIFHSLLGFNMGFVSDSLFAPLLSIPDAYHIFVKFLISTFSGHIAVDIFFAMSGCVLIMSSQRCLKAGDIRGSVIFVIRRAFRIMPALLFCVSVIAAVFWALSFSFPGMIAPYTKDQVFDNLMLWGMPIHGASWTLRVEMLAIPALAIVGLLYKKVGNAGLIFFLIFSILSFENPKLCLNHPDLSSSLIYFSLGALIPTELGAAIGKVRANIWLLIAAMMYERFLFSPYEGATIKIAQAGLCFWFLCQIYYGVPRKVVAFLSSPGSVFLGKISYSIYLWNVLFLNVMFALRPLFPVWMQSHPVISGSFASIFIGLATIPIAAVSEKYIERPFVALGKRIEDLFLHLTGGNSFPQVVSKT